MLPIFLVIRTKLIPQTKKAAGNIFGGGGIDKSQGRLRLAMLSRRGQEGVTKPKIWTPTLAPSNCAKNVRTRLSHKLYANIGAHAQFFRSFLSPPGIVPRTHSTELSHPGAIFLKSAAVQDRSVSTEEAIGTLKRATTTNSAFISGNSRCHM